MNKEQMALAIAKLRNISKSEALRFIDAFEEVFTAALEEQKPVKMVLGTFKTVTRKGRYYRNPQTGAQVWKDDWNVVKFSPAKELADKLN